MGADTPASGRGDESATTSGALVALAYVILIGANVAFTLYELRDTEAAATLRHHRDRLVNPLKAKPWLHPKLWRRMKNEVVVEAWMASEGQFEQGDIDGPS